MTKRSFSPPWRGRSSRRGIEVVCVASGREALRVVNLHDFDVAVIDVKMPGMDGVELFRHLKEVSCPSCRSSCSPPTARSRKLSKRGEKVSSIIWPNPVRWTCWWERSRRPLQRRSAKPAARGQEMSPPGVVRVLLVDDEVELLTSLSPVLSRRGMDVNTACEWRRSYSTFWSIRLSDVVVLDIKMPGMDGIQTLRRIKSDSPDVEVVLLTGHPDMDNAFQGMKQGAFDYIIKPPAIEELVDKIKSSLPKTTGETRAGTRGMVERHHGKVP